MEKLVRDKIPDIIRANGETPKVRKFAEHELLDALRNKLVEEAQELASATGRAEMIEELADLKEVYDTLVGKLNAWQEVTRARRCKAVQRGCFDEGYLLTMPDKPKAAP